MKKIFKSITALLIMLSLCTAYSLNMNVYAQENEADGTVTTEVGAIKKASTSIPAIEAYKSQSISTFAVDLYETFSEGDFTYTYLGDYFDEGEDRLYKLVELTSLDSSDTSITMPASVVHEGETYDIIQVATDAFAGKTINELYLEDMYLLWLFPTYDLCGATSDTGIVEIYVPGFIYKFTSGSQTIYAGESLTFDITITEYVNFQVANYSVANNEFEWIDEDDAKTKPYNGEEFIPEVQWYSNDEIIAGANELTYTTVFNQVGTYVIDATLNDVIIGNTHTVTVVEAPVEPNKPVTPTPEPATPVPPTAPSTTPTNNNVVQTGDATSTTIYVAGMASIIVAYVLKRKTSSN